MAAGEQSIQDSGTKEEATMIKRITEAGGSGFGFKATGAITAEDVKAIEPEIEREIARSHKRPIGILVDLTELKDVEWKARWEELRFLHKYGGPIARVAVVGARKWEELMAEVAGATVLMQADIRYFVPSETIHAWHWVKTAKFAEELPVRQLLPPGHLMSGYTPEYTDL
jgi:SpoIIAA-like